MKHVMVQYTVKPDRVAENKELVRAVYGELHETRPRGLRYATFKLDDGVSFVHLADHDEDGSDQLTQLDSFKRFQEGIAERCDEPPGVSEVNTIGAYPCSASHPGADSGVIGAPVAWANEYFDARPAAMDPRAPAYRRKKQPRRFGR